ncbi:MAG: argininosuccinate lyase [Actinobacteria bacterium]|nr:MAG: argininosuccinate lyase [Actinomycetota bacterium]
MKLWQGRFDKKTDKLVEQFSSSLADDIRLYKQDIAGSIAYGKMLAGQKIIKRAEANEIIKGLKEIGKKIKAGTFKFLGSDEDIHSAIERGLTSHIGSMAGKLHTGRSRNDQVATDMRLYIKEEITGLKKLIKGMQQAIVNLAEKNIDVVMPGYTHLQVAQPVLFSHYIMAYFWMLERDKKRLNCAYNHADILILGSAALAGTTYDIDRNFLAKELGFKNISENSMDAVADRDYLVVFLNAANLIMLHLSRLCEEMVIFSSAGFGFIKIDEAFTTGSSIMPQKQNPDVAELIRGKSAKVAANYQALSGIIKGLPLTYNRDLQEDKKIVFDSLDTISASLEVMTKMLSGIKLNTTSMLEAVQKSFANATDLADYLVGKKIPFRKAHGIVGQAVKICVKKGLYLHELPLSEFKKINSVFDEKLFDAIAIKNVIAARNSLGGTSPKQVKKQISLATSLLLRDKG